MKLCGYEVGNDRKLFLIAGPCVIESEALVMQVAERMANIAEKLAIAANTVRVHVGRIYEKLGVANKAELASMMADYTG